METTIWNIGVCRLWTLHHLVPGRDRLDQRNTHAARGGSLMVAQQITRPAAISLDHLLQPKWAEVMRISKEINDVSTYWLKFTDPPIQKGYTFEPGQINMLYIPGFGESAISICSDPSDHSMIGHSVRFVGNVTNAV